MSDQYIQPLNIHQIPPNASTSTSFSVGVLGSPRLSAARSNVSEVDTIDLIPSLGASKKCHCKRSKCLKLYCECFAANVLCDGCKCDDCENTQEFTDSRRAAVQYKLSRNRAAFEPKFKPNMPDLGVSEFSHIRGCNCKRSNCRKKYCECFQAGIECSSACKCVQCANDGSLPHLRNFGVHNWMLPSCREAVGSVIGVESVMMILPTAEAEPEAPPPCRPKKRRSSKHKRANSCDAVTNTTTCPQQQQSLLWDDFTMESTNVSPPLKELWDPVTIEDDDTEPACQRRRISEDISEVDLEQFGLTSMELEEPSTPTPGSGDALIAGLLRLDDGEDLTPRRRKSTESLSVDQGVECELMSPCCVEHSENSMLLDMMDDTRGVGMFNTAVSC